MSDINLVQIIKDIFNKNLPSDIHIGSSKSISIRVNGEMILTESSILDEASVWNFISANLTAEEILHFKKSGSVDFAVILEDLRFRANAYKTLNGTFCVLRIIPTNIPDYKEFGIPSTVIELCSEKSGLILVTGPTGSGKSTTLAMIVDQINQRYAHSVITIEDPIEFIHKDKRSVISQRQIGQHVPDFGTALRASLREDPDVILLGELRDLETISLALTAAETGHLVLATLHTSSAPSTISRIVDVFPASQQEQVRTQLAEALSAVVSQRLIRGPKGESRNGAFEIMLNNNPIANLIRENKLFQINSVIQTNAALGMITMDASIARLKAQGKA